MKPIIKYRGGKSREIFHFLKYLPEKYDTYLEPFVGGGAFYFHLEPEKAIINDVNSKLITFYNQLKKDFDTLTDQLRVLQSLYEQNQREYDALKQLNPDIKVENNNEKLYYDLREIFNYPDDTYLEGTIYYFINKTAYSGMIRYNKNGEYNVPFGRYRNFNTNLITEQHHRLLSATDLYCTDYSMIFNMAQERDFMFLDPPYDCVFNDYGNLAFEEGFNEDEHRRLAEDYRNLSCPTLMVVSKTPLTEILYSTFITDEYHKSYAVNIRNRFKNEARHVIVKNY